MGGKDLPVRLLNLAVLTSQPDLKPLQSVIEHDGNFKLPLLHGYRSEREVGDRGLILVERANHIPLRVLFLKMGTQGSHEA